MGNPDFGVVIAVTDYDLHLAQGCLASIRHFMGEVPVCLLIDGPLDVEPLGRQYGVLELRKSDVKSRLLRDHSFGWGWTKMVAIWEAPFETFMYLDADTVVWGDMSVHADFANYDIIGDKSKRPGSKAGINHHFFDTDLLAKLAPDFDWEKSINQYFCVGVNFVRRGALDLAEYEQAQRWLVEHPGLFPFGEMGIYNFLMQRAAQNGRVRMKQVPFQTILWDHTRDEMEARLRFDAQGLPILLESPEVIHWAGPKPNRFRPSIYSPPMDFFRRKHFAGAGLSPAPARRRMLSEDLRHFRTFVRNKLQKRLRVYRNKGDYSKTKSPVPGY